MLNRFEVGAAEGFENGEEENVRKLLRTLLAASTFFGACGGDALEERLADCLWTAVVAGWGVEDTREGG